MKFKRLLSKAAIPLLLAATASFILPASSSSRAANIDPVVNPGFEQTWTSPSDAYDWQNFGQGYQRVTGVKRSGTASIRMTSSSKTGLSGAYQRVDFQQTSLKPVFVGGYVKGNRISMAAGSYFGASLYTEIHLTNGQTVYWNTVSNSGTFDWRWIGFNTATIPWITAPIDYIFVIPSLIYASGTAYFDDLTAVETEPSAPAVTVMFDDAEDNHYTKAFPVMEQYGLKGSLAVPSGLLNTEGYLTSDELTEMHNSGWDVVSHGVNHVDFTKLNSRQLQRELQNSLVTLAPWLTARHLALPFGAYNSNVVAEAAKYYQSVRPFELGDNPQGSYPYNIKVQGVVETTTPAEISSWIAEAQANNTWLVIVFHTIGQGDDAYHTDEATFSSMVQTIANSHVPVLSYGDAFNKFAMKP